MAYNKEIKSNYLDYFPDMNAPSNPNQFFTLDGRTSGSLKMFRQDYKKMLGGLLVDYQSFLISEVDENGDLIQYVGAFNLVEGVLSERYFQQSGSQRGLILAPTISDGNFNGAIMLQLSKVMNQFYNDYAIISHERVGGNSGTARKINEYPLWMSICTTLPFINFAF